MYISYFLLCLNFKQAQVVTKIICKYMLIYIIFDNYFPQTAPLLSSSEWSIYFCFIDYAKAFVWITTNWKILQEMGITDHLTSLLRNLYSGQGATVRTEHGLVPNWERSTSGLYTVTLLI